MAKEEKTLGSQVIYKGGFLEIRKDEVLLPDGKRSTREYCASWTSSFPAGNSIITCLTG